MRTNHGHLTYCSNIHSGEDWEAHFNELKKYFPEIKIKCSPKSAMGIGLRLSAKAAQKLSKKNELAGFKNWLQEQNAYVFTLNGFPYSGFHKTVVKDKVHAPDWTTSKRVVYTKHLANLLTELLPDNMEGSISTSPISYRHWHSGDKKTVRVLKKSTENLISVVEHLISLREKHGKTIFLAIEPEPDGTLTDTLSFIRWYNAELLKHGADLLCQKLGVTLLKARSMLRKYIRLCYDICHAAVNYESHVFNIQKLQKSKIKIGKIQISAALKATFNQKNVLNRLLVKELKKYSEPVYLHQVITRNSKNQYNSYSDLPEALNTPNPPDTKEWRIHYHVPIFTKKINPLSTTQADIITVLNLHKNSTLSNHLEIETYTWEVLPRPLKKSISESIIREIKWVTTQLNK